eukprot:4656937-Pleurochrysis_carterae.AAC.1
MRRTGSASALLRAAPAALARRQHAAHNPPTARFRASLSGHVFVVIASQLSLQIRQPLRPT